VASTHVNREAQESTQILLIKRCQKSSEFAAEAEGGTPYHRDVSSYGVLALASFDGMDIDFNFGAFSARTYPFAKSLNYRS
jgi:hypothetical protein